MKRATLDTEDDEILFENGLPKSKRTIMENEIPLDELLNSLANNRPQRTQASMQAIEQRKENVIRRQIRSAVDKAEIDRRVNEKVVELKNNKKTVNRSVRQQIEAEIKKAYKLEKWGNATDNLINDSTSSISETFSTPNSNDLKRRLSLNLTRLIESGANEIIMVEDDECETIRLIKKHKDYLLSQLNTLERDSDEWVAIGLNLNSNNFHLISENNLLKEKLSEIESSLVRENLVTTIKGWNNDQISATESVLSLSTDEKVIDCLNLMKSKHLENASNEQLEIITNAFDCSTMSPKYLEQKAELVESCLMIDGIVKELIIQDIGDFTNKAESAELLLLLQTPLDKLSNNQLEKVRNIFMGSRHHPINVQKKKEMVELLNKLDDEFSDRLLDNLTKNKNLSELEKESLVLLSGDNLEQADLTHLDLLWQLHLKLSEAANWNRLKDWFSKLNPNKWMEIKDDDLDHLSTDQLSAMVKLKGGLINELSYDELNSLKQFFNELEVDETQKGIGIETDLEVLERMENKYTLQKYCVSIHSEGLAANKYAGNMLHRIREIKRISKASRILSASINGDLATKKVYTKVETDSKDDYLKLLNCEWPSGSFGTNSITTVEREWLGFKLELLNVDKSIRLEKETDSIRKLKDMGLRNICRSYRIDHSSMEETVTNRVSFNVKDLLVLKMVLSEMIPIECTKQAHTVAPFIERVRTCKNCQSFEHNAKQCRNQPLCGRCSSTEHNVASCPSRTSIKCCHCNLKHEAGSNKCKITFAENYKRNEFLIRFMIDECGAGSPYSVLNVPVPDGMTFDDDGIQCDQNDCDKELMLDYLDAYLLSNRISSGDDNLRLELETLKKVTYANCNKIEALELNQDKMVQEIKGLEGKLTDEITKLDDKIDRKVNELKTDIHSCRDELTEKINDVKDDMYDKLDSMQESANINAVRSEKKIDGLGVMMEQLMNKLVR